MISLNGGYAMIKYNSTQEELQIAYRSKKPVLCYDENRRAHWAVIEETATESVDEETQEPITIYEYSYRLIDEASGGTQLYEHNIDLNFSTSLGNVSLRIETSISEPFTISTLYQWFIDNEIIYDESLQEYNFFPVEMYKMGNWHYYINGLSAVTNETNKFFVNALYFKSDSNALAMVLNAYEPASITDVVKLK